MEDPFAAALDARAARDAGADLVEFRVDPFFTGSGDPAEIEAVVRLVAECPVASIVTCRPVLEGGHYGGPDDARISLFERLGTARGAGERAPAYIDVELATYARSENIRQKVNLAVDHPGQVREVPTALILSSHDFHTRPPDLIRRLEAMYKEPAARVVKVAFRARSLRDDLEILEILAQSEHLGKPLIALGMGPFGLMSRALAPKFGGFLTFASLRRGSATAPGQPVLSELVDLYRFRSIDSATAVYGVLGWPVEHSISPLVHNAGFEAIGHNGVYLPLPVPPEYEHFKATLPALIDHAHLDLHGCSVTLPHKEHLVRLALESYEDGDGRWEVDPLARACGAANTLTIRRDPKGRAAALRVSNTDGPGLLAALAGAGLSAPALADRDVVVLGAGGTARAAAAALAGAGARVHVLNRSPERAATLAADLEPAFPGRVRAIAGLPLPGLQPVALINATSAGLRTGAAPLESPLPEASLAALPPSCVVADCVYDPLRTPLLEHAARAGLATVDGLALFVAQAGAQFEAWTGRPAPLRLFERIARETMEARLRAPA